MSSRVRPGAPAHRSVMVADIEEICREVSPDLKFDRGALEHIVATANYWGGGMAALAEKDRMPLSKKQYEALMAWCARHAEEGRRGAQAAIEDLRAEVGDRAYRLLLNYWDPRILTLMRALEGARDLVEPLPPENDSPKQVTARKDIIAPMIWQAVEHALEAQHRQRLPEQPLLNGVDTKRHSAGTSQNDKAVRVVGKIMVKLGYSDGPQGAATPNAIAKVVKKFVVERRGAKTRVQLALLPQKK